MDQHPDKRCHQKHELHRKPTNTVLHCRARLVQRHLDAENDVFRLEDQTQFVQKQQQCTTART